MDLTNLVHDAVLETLGENFLTVEVKVDEEVRGINHVRGELEVAVTDALALGPLDEEPNSEWVALGELEHKLSSLILTSPVIVHGSLVERARVAKTLELDPDLHFFRPLSDDHLQHCCEMVFTKQIMVSAFVVKFE